MGEAQRRKKLGLEGHERDAEELGSIEKDQIVATIRRLPSWLWLIDCNTQDQRDHWFGLKEDYAKLEGAFAAYFGGESPDDLYESRKERELYETWAQYYLVFYQVLRYAWPSIKPHLEERELSRCDKPGDLIKLLILMECHETFRICQEFVEFSQRKTYDLLGNQKDYASLMKYYRGRGINWMIVPEFTLELLRWAGLHSRKDSLTRKALKAFWIHHDDERSLLKRNVPPSQSWDGKGNRRLGQSHGSYG